MLTMPIMAFYGFERSTYKSLWTTIFRIEDYELKESITTGSLATLRMMIISTFSKCLTMNCLKASMGYSFFPI
jgi:hypothetical protein